MKKLFLLLIISLLIGCSELNVQVYDEDYHQLNEEALEALDNGEFNRAIDLLEEAIEKDPEASTAYNSLGYAYIEIEEFDKAIIELNKAIEITPDYSYAYSNLGNAYIALNDMENGEKAYLSSVEHDKSNSYGHYGLAIIYRDSGKYDKAIEHYDLAISYDKDIDYRVSKLDCMIIYEEYIDGISYANEAIEENPNHYELYELKGMILEQIGKEDDIIEFYTDVLDQFPDEINAILSLGVYYYWHEQYEKAIESFTEHKDIETAHVWLGYCYQAIENYTQSKKIALEIISLYPRSYEGYNLMGNSLSFESDYMKASEYFEKALEYAIDDTPAVNLVSCLSSGLRYQRSIDRGLALIEDYPFSSDLHYEIMSSYFYRNDYLEAIEFAKKYFDLTEDPSAHYIIALCYYYLNDFNKSLEFTERYLDYDPQNENALSLQSSIQTKSSSDLDQITGYFSNYYLYNYNADAFDDYSDPLSNQDVIKLFEATKAIDDPYTFALTDDDYNYITDASNNPLQIKSLDDKTVYFKFNRFDDNIDHHVIEAIDEIESPKNKALVLDLRDNLGGSTISANNILNVLLPDLLVSQLIYKDGYSDPYYSDKSMVEFEHIYILVNENTISASELLALGLKTYLDHVTIIGQNTYGKGVGQDVFDDEINKRMYYIVSHYWNVREQNISNTGITPDILVEGHELEDYLEEIQR